MEIAAARVLAIGSSDFYASLHPLMGMKSEPRIGLSDSRSTKANSKNKKTTRVLLARSADPKSEPQREEDKNNNDNNNKAFPYQEDLGFLWKLGGGSVGGAVVIKYGSVLFPQITRPNIGEALVMILTPVIVSVLILIKQSYVGGESKD